MQPPRLAPDPARAVWRCGEALPGRLDAAEALLRSCNGWFLDWAAQVPEVARLGRWGPVLVALGLSAIPADAAEAIGVRPSLRISPLGLAQAYRLLAEARPDLLDALSRTAREGTLAGAEGAAGLIGVAVKTGTVLDAAASPRQGWIVAVDRDVVLVMARAGRIPRTFAGEAAEALARARAPGREAARVQLFGLVGAGAVRGRCDGLRRGPRGSGPGTPAREPSGAPRPGAGPDRSCVPAGPGWSRSPGAPRRVPTQGSSASIRPPSRRRRRRRPPASCAPAAAPTSSSPPPASPTLPASSRRRTRRAPGEPRVALARVADANVRHPRHPGRPLCDTTHCQVFLGTAPPRAEDRQALAEPLPAGRWLHFSRGGVEPWREVRPVEAVRRALGEGARDLAFGGGEVSFGVSAADGAQRWEERRTLPCERLRGPLKLPACPERAVLKGGAMTFTGRGQGHGEGLDVEWARRSGRTAAEILTEAYGAEPVGR